MVMVSRSGSVHVFQLNLTDSFSLAGGVGEGVGQTGRYSKAAVGPDGRIVVAEPGRVQVFSPDGEFESLFGIGPHQSTAIDVDIGPDGLIVLNHPGGYMADPHIRAFYLNGTPAFSFPIADWEPFTWVDPLHVAVGPDGEIVTFETGTMWPRHFVDSTIRVYRPLPNGTFSHFPFNGTIYQPLPNGTLVVVVPDIEAGTPY